ncbi:MAG: DUF3892 domain-containing protein [Chitinophagaceae bacterium]|nr:DUF3892 domain-containing protein [Chitinophagaceae bacterium]
MPSYYITAIKKETVNNHTFITQVLIHETNESTVFRRQVKAKDEVIKLIKARNSVYTATWNYQNIAWGRQETVAYETRNGVEYLRTTPDASQRDNLLHLLNLANLGF